MIDFSSFIAKLYCLPENSLFGLKKTYQVWWTVLIMVFVKNDINVFIPVGKIPFHLLARIRDMCNTFFFFLVTQYYGSEWQLWLPLYKTASECITKIDIKQRKMPKQQLFAHALLEALENMTTKSNRYKQSYLVYETIDGKCHNYHDSASYRAWRMFLSASYKKQKNSTCTGCMEIFDFWETF